ncbi:Unknown protein [Striga hermonthica]|uniref:Uncharacterized protein n=1 Tax=Striga hermonthica TaxID=68872 RepID=A0A9N7RD27_STRHE|nr:Unknown protein [Striga hermonthica]
MPRKNSNLDGKIGGRKKCRVRKRGCSSSSSSSLHQKCRIKRAFSVGKKTGSSTPVPKWKKPMGSPEIDGLLKLLAASNGGLRAEGLSVSARKLAATLWEIDGLPSARLKGEYSSEEVCEVGFFNGKNFEHSKLESKGSKAVALNDLSSHSPVSEMMMDLPKVGSHRRRASAGSQKTMHTDCHLGVGKSIHDCLVENRARSPYKNLVEPKNRLKDIYNGLMTSKELLKVMGRVSRLDHHNSTDLSLFSALKFELDRAFFHVVELSQEQKQKQTDIEALCKHFQEEKKSLWNKLRQQQDKTRMELEKEKKLRLQTERLNTKLGRDLSETKELLLKANEDLEGETRARVMLERVRDELAQEVEELKKQSGRVCEELEKEREMFQLADVLREERVRMKLSEAKYRFEEKNAIVDKLRGELESYLMKSKKCEENRSPRYDKIKELEKYLRETLPLPCAYEYEEDRVKNDIGIVNEVEDVEDDCNSDDSDLHSIELRADDYIGKNLNAFEGKGLFEFASRPWRKEVVVDEIERYNMIKDLRDHIVSGSKMGLPQDSASPCENELTRERTHCSKDFNGVACQG